MPFFNSNNIERNFFSGYTNISSATTFIASVNCGSNPNTSTRWEFPNNISQTTGTTHYNIPGSDLRMFKAYVNKKSNIQDYVFSNTGIVGSVDIFSKHDNLNPQYQASTVQFSSNPGLSAFTIPIGSNRFTRIFNMAQCSLSGVVDLTRLNFSGFSNGEYLSLDLSVNSNVNSILLKDLFYNNPVLLMQMNDCSLGTPPTAPTAGTLNFNTTVDLKKFTALGGSVTLTSGGYPHSNSAITQVFFPDKPSGGTFYQIAMNGLPNYTGHSYNLDLSWANGNLGGGLIFNHLPQITGMTFYSAETSGVYQLDVSFCDIQGTLDVSPLHSLNTYLIFNNNTGLTSVNFYPSSGLNLSQLNLSHTSIKNLDLTNYNGIGDYTCSLNDCPYLTGVTFPNNLNINTGCYLPSFYNSDFRDLDLTYTHVAHPYGTRLQSFNNPNLTGFTFPKEIVNNFTGSCYESINFNNCNIQKFVIENLSGINHNILSVGLVDNTMSASIVNSILSKFDNIGWTGNSINIGGNNAAPDHTRGGIDGIAAKFSLSGKGWSVVTN